MKISKCTFCFSPFRSFALFSFFLSSSSLLFISIPSSLVLFLDLRHFAFHSLFYTLLVPSSSAINGLAYSWQKIATPGPNPNPYSILNPDCNPDHNLRWHGAAKPHHFGGRRTICFITRPSSKSFSLSLSASLSSLASHTLSGYL